MSHLKKHVNQQTIKQQAKNETHEKHRKHKQLSPRNLIRFQSFAALLFISDNTILYHAFASLEREYVEQLGTN